MNRFHGPVKKRSSSEVQGRAEVNSLKDSTKALGKTLNLTSQPKKKGGCGREGRGSRERQDVDVSGGLSDYFGRNELRRGK